jgi:hypothetical protein
MMAVSLPLELPLLHRAVRASCFVTFTPRDSRARTGGEASCTGG